MTQGNNVASDLKGLPQISASKIKTYRSCARKFYYSYIEKPTKEENKEEKNVAALLGTTLHRVIEAKYKNPQINPLALYQEKMLSLLQEWEDVGYKINGEQYFGKSLKEGREILEQFQWDRFSPRALEFYFSLPFPMIDPIAKITGYIDMITDDGIVIDHKSQRAIENTEEMANNAQFILYRYAFHAINNVYPRSVAWHDLRTQQLIDTGVHVDYDIKLAKLTEDITAMLNATHYSRINLSAQCKRECSFYNLCWQGG